MGSPEKQTSDAVRMAREDDFSNGVSWGVLENRQAWRTPGLR